MNVYEDRPDFLETTYEPGGELEPVESVEPVEQMGDFSDLINEIRARFRAGEGKMQLQTKGGTFELTPEGLKILRPSVEKPADQVVELLKNPLVIGSIAVLLLLLFMGKRK